MIVVLDGDYRPVSGIRLRPAQSAAFHLQSDSATPKSLLIQALRADYTKTPPNGEADSVSRGNGQELLDSDLVEVLVSDTWHSISEPVEIGLISQLDPLALEIRVKNVGGAVGEVDFGLAFIELEPRAPDPGLEVKDTLSVAGYARDFVRVAERYWIMLPPSAEPTINYGGMRVWFDFDAIGLEALVISEELNLWVTLLATVVGGEAELIAASEDGTPDGYIAREVVRFDDLARIEIAHGAELAEVLVTDDIDVWGANLEDTMVTFQSLTAVSGEEYTHAMIVDFGVEVTFYAKIVYDAGSEQWQFWLDTGSGFSLELATDGEPARVPNVWRSESTWLVMLAKGD